MREKKMVHIVRLLVDFLNTLFFDALSSSLTTLHHIQLRSKKTWAKHIYISQLKRFPKRDTSCKWHKFRLDLKVSYDYYFLSPFSIHICIHIYMPVYDWRFISQANLNDRRKSQILNLLFVVNYVIFFFFIRLLKFSLNRARCVAHSIMYSIISVDI